MVDQKQAARHADTEITGCPVQGKEHVKELKREPSLIVCQDIISAKMQIDTVDHASFLEGVTNVSEKLFSSPDVEA